MLKLIIKKNLLTILFYIIINVISFIVFFVSVLIYQGLLDQHGEWDGVTTASITTLILTCFLYFLFGWFMKSTRKVYFDVASIIVFPILSLMLFNTWNRFLLGFAFQQDNEYFSVIAVVGSTLLFFAGMQVRRLLKGRAEVPN